MNESESEPARASEGGNSASGRSRSWRALFDETKHRVGDRAVAGWLCEEASGVDVLAAVFVDPATATQVARLDAMVERIVDGEPLAYVLGHWSFRHLELAVDRRVLIPRPETEVVAGIAIELARSLPRPITVADLGTGSGAIGLALADELPADGVTVWLTDASADATAVAGANLAGMGRRATNVRIATGDWFSALVDGTRLDLAVSNPPYIADRSGLVDESVRAWEPHEALFAGGDGLDHIRTLATDGPRWIRPGGWLVIEIGADQGEAVRDLLLVGGYESVEIRVDLAGRDRVAIGRVFG